MKKICVVTGTRAEYGLLRWLMEGISQSKYLELQLVVTGAHLSPEFGLTYKTIEDDGFTISRKVEMLLSSDTVVGVTKSMGLAVCGFADALADLSPDMLLVLGDRYEILAAASAATIARIPVIHLHGGELTEGAIDEAIRHAITKMSHLHFVAAEAYRQRVIQLGEQPERVFCVGGLGIDNIQRLPLMDRPSLEESLGFALGRKNLLVTFHPTTLEPGTAAAQMQELMNALSVLEDTHLIFTLPNADTEGRQLFELVRTFASKHPDRARVYSSLGQLRYLSVVRHVDAVVGNSSSGLIEVPTLGKPTINIGDRQRGRLKAASVIDCEPHKDSILAALAIGYSPEFQERLVRVENPYGTGGASAKIVKVLEEMDVGCLLKKTFFDLPISSRWEHDEN
jgi:GDP/UDP-N,N'-diacetylbacillosamine 2-epimerase (hydrolysing)